MRRLAARFRAVAGTGLVLALLPASAHAGAWTKPPGEGWAALSYERYRTTTKFDESGSKVDLALDGEFVKQSLRLYTEIGVLDRVTAFGNFYYDFLSYGQSDLRFPLENSGFSDQEAGVRYGLFEQPIALASQLSLHFPAGYDTDVPSPPAEQPPLLGTGEWGAEFRIAAGRGLGRDLTLGFVNAEVGYNTRWSGFADQLKLEVTIGYKRIPRTELNVVWNYTNTFGEVPSAGSQVQASNPLVFSIYDLHRLELRAVVRVWRWWHAQGAFFAHVAGSNVGAGSGVSLGVRGVWPEP